MFLRALVATVILLICVASDVSSKTPNRCPQPTEEIPTPTPLYYGDSDNCRNYYNCGFGTANLQPCAPGTVWSDEFYACVPFNGHFDTCTRENAQRECARRNEEPLLIAHPKYCQRYFNCSKTTPPAKNSHLGLYEDECVYPNLFDVTANECRSFETAFCGPIRKVAKDACDYVKNQYCTGVGECEPCPSRLPSCVGLSDGTHEHPLKIWSIYYILCNKERLDWVGICTKVTFFSPIKNHCVPQSEVPPEYLEASHAQ